MKKVFLFPVVIIMSCQLWVQAQKPELAIVGSLHDRAEQTDSYNVSESVSDITIADKPEAVNIPEQITEKINSLLTKKAVDFGSFVIYPNTTADQVWMGFQLNAPGKVTVSVYDGDGQTVAELYHCVCKPGNLIEPAALDLIGDGTYYITMVYTNDIDGKDYTLTRQLQISRPPN